MNYLSYFEYIECQRFSRGRFHTVERSENLVTFPDIQATEFDQLYLIKQKMPFGFASERASGKSNMRSCPLCRPLEIKEQPEAAFIFLKGTCSSPTLYFYSWTVLE